MKKYLKLFCLTLITGLLLMTVSFTSHAKNMTPPQALGQTQVNQSTGTESVKSKNYSRWLNTGESLMIDGYLFEGEQLVGTCSEDCYGVRLTLHDDQHPEPVAHGVRQAKTSILDIPYEGPFTVQLTMENCATNRGCRAWVESEHPF